MKSNIAKSRQEALKKQVKFYANKLPLPRCESCSDLGQLMAEHTDVVVVDVRTSAEQKVHGSIMRWLQYGYALWANVRYINGDDLVQCVWTVQTRYSNGHKVRQSNSSASHLVVSRLPLSSLLTC